MHNSWSVLIVSSLFWALQALGQETAALATLPEGDHGLAAKYPGDAGIERDPAVVFTDGFEGFEDDTVVTGLVPQKGNKWDAVIHTVRITQKPENVHAGKKAMEVQHEEPMSHGLDKHFPDGYEIIHVRYYMKYHKEFMGCHHAGAIFWALAPGQIKSSGAANSSTGVKPNGHNHFTAALDTAPPWARYVPGVNRAPGKLNIYCYHMDQDRRWGDLFFPSGVVYPSKNSAIFGKDFVPHPDFDVEVDRWNCYELMLKANTPGKCYGRVAFWVDGRLTGDFPNLRFRDVETLKVNVLTLGSYSSSRHANTIMWYDDVVVASSYIGPMVEAKRASAAP